jgi:hypothetical protein
MRSLFRGFCVPLLMLLITSSTPGEDGPSFPEQSLRGKSYKPKKRKIARDLSNWDVLDQLEGKIRAVRVFGFDPYNSGKPLDFESKDALVLRTIEYTAHASSAVRPAVSDLRTPYGSGADGAYLGIMKLDTADGPLIIGVSRIGFFLGVWDGSVRQTFFSWGLAKQVDDLLFNATGKHLEAEHFEALSGEERIKVGKKAYEDARRPPKGEKK